jgi:hypothetical protein
MVNAHCDSIAILGECLTSKGSFDFSKQVFRLYAYLNESYNCRM